MLKGMFVDEHKLVDHLAASADVFNGNPTTDWVDMEDYRKHTFIFKHSGGTTGTATFTVNAGDNAAGDNPVAIPFKYTKLTSGAYGTTTQATASGVGTTAAQAAIFAIEVNAEDLPAGKKFVSLTATETVNDPVAGCCIGISSNGRLGVTPSAIA